MMEEDFDAIHVQPLHIIPGFEYEKVACAVRLANHKTSIPISLGNPLLFEEADYDEVVEALLTRLPDFEANKGIVLMGHGTDHYANACYSMLQAKINERPVGYPYCQCRRLSGFGACGSQTGILRGCDPGAAYACGGRPCAK